MNEVLIVGTGLIGASIGLALREAGFAGGVIGIDASGDELAAAQKMGAVDHAARSPDEHRAAIQKADVIILAVPVLAILQWMQVIRPLLRAGQLVTDVGSTKAQIAAAALERMPDHFPTRAPPWLARKAAAQHRRRHHSFRVQRGSSRLCTKRVPWSKRGVRG